MNKIPYGVRKDVYLQALNAYGSAAQHQMAIEEMSELTKEICKISRGKMNMEALVDEIADVTIMLEQLRMIHGIDAEVSARMDFKVMRLARNLSGEDGGG